MTQEASPKNNPDSLQPNLRERTLSGASWSFLKQGVGTAVQFAIGVVLARLLPPEDFGLIGLAYIVMGFGSLFVTLGLGPALVQRRNLSERHIRVAFTTSALAGLVLCLVVYAAAPWAAVLLGDGRVTPILKVLCITFILSGLQVPSQALMQRRMAFRKLFRISLVNIGIYGSATIVMALAGFGVWSLVLGIVLQRMVNLVQNYAAVRHSVVPLLARREAKDLARFGAGMSMASVFNYFALQGDYFVVGRVLGARTLGLYTRAYSLMQMPTQRFVRVLTDVLFPAASKVQDDPVRFRRAYLHALTTISFFVMPAVGLLSVLAPELIIGIYGEEWAGAIAPLQILAGFGLLRAAYNGAAAFLRAKGWVYRILACQVVYGALLFGGTWIAAQRWGLTGVAWAVSGAITVMWMLIMYYGSRASATSLRDAFRTLQPGAVLALPAVGAAAGLRYALVLADLSPLLILASCLGASMLVWLAGLLWMPQRWLNYLPHKLLTLVEGKVPASGRSVYTWAARRLKPACPQHSPMHK